MNANETNTMKEVNAALNGTSPNGYAIRIHTDSSKPDSQEHRLSVCNFKTPRKEKDNKDYKKPAARSVSIPKFVILVEPTVLQVAITNAFYDLQDQIIRDKITKAIAESKDGNPTIFLTDQEISAQAVADYAAEVASGGKLSAKAIEEWYDTSLEEALFLAIAAKLGLGNSPTPEETAKLDAVMKQHRELIVGLASTTVNYSEKLSKNLLLAVQKAGDGDRIRQQLENKLQKFIQPKEVTIDIGLGE